MTLPYETIQRYYDGELAAGEMESVERVLSVDPEARAELERLRHLGDGLRSSFSLVEAPDLADSVMEAIAREESTGGSARRRTAFISPRSMVGSAVLAAAAACLLWIGLWRGQESEGGGEPAPGLEARGEAALASEALAARPPAIAIESVEFGATSGAIFMVSAGDEAVPVVWLNEDWSGEASDLEPPAPDLSGGTGRASPL